MENRLITECSLDEKQMDRLFIDWSLLTDSRFGLVGDSAEEPTGNFVATPERLLRSAWRVLGISASAYRFLFSGWEPARHPSFKSLIRYLLASKRDVEIEIMTGGALEPAQYLPIVKSAAPGKIHIHLIPGGASPADMMVLLAAVTENGQRASALIPQEGQKCSQLFETLDKFRKKTGLDFAIGAWDGSIHGAAKLFAEFGGAASGPSRTVDTRVGLQTDCYCRQGDNFFHIDPEGFLYGAMCEMALPYGPLWDVNADISGARRIFKCPLEECEGGWSSSLPKFPSIVAAEEWGAAKARRLVGREPLQEFGRADPDPEIVCQARLKLMASGGASGKIRAYPQLAGRIKDLAAVFSALADEESRRVFLGCVKALLEGEAGYFQNASYSPFRNPEADEERDDAVFLDPCRNGTLLQIVEPVAEIRSFRAVIRELQPKLQIALAPKPEGVVDVPLWLVKNFPEYKYYYGRHAETGEIILYGAPPALRFYPRWARPDFKTSRAGEALRREVRARLDALKPLRRGVDRIDPAETAVVIMGCALDSAVAHYRALNLPQMPVFVIADWSEESRRDLEKAAAAHDVSVVPVFERGNLKQKQFCVYGVPDPTGWQIPGSFYQVGRYYNEVTKDDSFMVDLTAIRKLWQRRPDPEFINKRFDDICIIYENCADVLSKDAFLRAIKNIEVGDAGFLPMAAYPIYHHHAAKVAPGDVVIEGGIFDGFTTKQFAEETGNKGRVIGFEALPRLCAQSAVNISKYKNTLIENLALYSGKNTFFIEDHGAGSSIRDKQISGSIQVEAIDIDTYLRHKNIKCDYIKLDIEGSELECLKGAKETISKYFPKLNISIYHETNHYVEIPLWILKNFPSYKIFFGHHNIWHTDTILYCRPPEPVSRTHVLVSIIIPAWNSAHTLKRAIDSALIQKPDDIELIMVNDGSTDVTGTIMEEYAGFYPEIARVIHLNENHGPGFVRNVGMDAARGEYIAFLDADDVLAPDFASLAVSAMREKKGDIACFSIVINRKGKDAEIHQNVAGEWANAKSMRQFLLGASGCHAAWGCVFRASFLRAWNIRFPERRLHEDMVFGVRAFYHSNRTIILPEVGYYRHITQGSLTTRPQGKEDFQAFADFVDFLTTFYEDHDLDMEDEAYAACVRQVYEWDRARLFAAVSSALAEKRTKELFSGPHALKIARSRAALGCLISDYAEINSATTGKRGIAPSGPDWREEAAREASPLILIPYGIATEPVGTRPFLSVIMANYNKERHIGKTVATILSQGMSDFELVVVDDASTDASYAMLQDIADADPRIRLFRMKSNAGQSAAQNAALDLVRGSYVVFADSDDLVEPGFFERAAADAATWSPDMMIYSIRYKREDGSIVYKKSLPDAQLSRNEALGMWARGRIFPATWGKAYKTAFLRAAGARFQEGVYHEDQLFVSGLLLHVRSVRSSSFMAYSSVTTADSIMRRGVYSYKYIHSAILLYERFNQIAGSDFWRHEIFRDEHTVYNFEKLALPAWQAWMERSGVLALTDADFNILKHNFHFIFSLLTRAAMLKAASKAAFPKPRARRATAPLGCINAMENPLVSVVIPVCNQEDGLGRCLDSVLSQTLRSLEAILVDDASTDSSWAIACAYARKDSRVRLFRNSVNSGKGVCRNLGIKEATGKYLAFVDGDDYVLPDFLLSGIRQLKKDEDADFVQFAFARDSELKGGGSIRPKRRVINGSVALQSLCLGQTPYAAVWGKIFRLSYIKANCPLFSDHFFADSAWLIEACGKAYKIITDPAVAYVCCETEHAPSIMKPIKCTPGKVHGFFAFCAGVTHTFAENFQDSGMDRFARMSIRNFQSSFRGSILDYLVSLDRTKRMPITDADLDNLRASPELFECLLSDYANLLSNKNDPPETAASTMLPFVEIDPAGAPALLSVIIMDGENLASTDIAAILKKYPGLEVIALVDGDRPSVSKSGIRRAFAYGGAPLGGWKDALKAATGEYVCFMSAANLDSAPLAGALRSLDDKGSDLYLPPGFPGSDLGAILDYPLGNAIFHKSFLESLDAATLWIILPLAWIKANQIGRWAGIGATQEQWRGSGFFVEALAGIEALLGALPDLDAKIGRAEEALARWLLAEEGVARRKFFPQFTDAPAELMGEAMRVLGLSNVFLREWIMDFARLEKEGV